LSSAIYAWGIHLKGPVYVAMFKPLSIVIAVAMGVMFLGDTLYVGRLVLQLSHFDSSLEHSEVIRQMHMDKAIAKKIISLSENSLCFLLI